MEKQLFANPDLCTGCNRCATACSAMKEGRFAPTRGRIRINNFPNRGFSVPSVCFQCPKGECLEACPMEAIYRDDAGVLLVDAERCNGCNACAEACTYGMIELNEQNVAYKCDYCGGDPACVKECHASALVFAPGQPDLIRLKAAQMKTRTRTGLPGARRQAMACKLLEAARG